MNSGPLFVVCLIAAVSVAAPVAPMKPKAVSVFSLHDVRLLGGPLKHSQDVAGQYLLSLDLDRLLARYRLEAGLPPKAENYPGWEDKELPGVGLGFYLSGCARFFAVTGEAVYRERLEYAINELDACQAAFGDGYLLATRNGRKLFSEIEAGDIRWGGGWNLNGECEPYYAMEKLFSGLRDAYRHAGSEKALQIAVRLGDWLDRHMSHLSDAQMDILMQCEYGGMNWVLSDLYADTGDPRYLALSRRWHDKSIEDPLARREDCLPGKHANTQFPKICGLAARFPYSGDAADRAAAEFFWERVALHHSYVTGGNSENEHFGPPDRLSDRLSPADTELCNSYNMLRLTALLFELAPRPEYADYYERVLFNHILAAQHPEDGRICYFTPLASGYARQYEQLYGRFACCTCSSFESYARHGEFIYAHDKDALFVNLFAASELTWHEKGVTLRQDTQFPDEGVVRFTLSCDKPVEFSLCLRCPAWCAGSMAVSLNGTRQPEGACRDGYAVLRRVWQAGDRVELTLPMNLHIEAMPDNANRIAFFAGPVLLAAAVDSVAEEEDEDAAAPVLVPEGKSLVEALSAVEGQPLAFQLTGIVRPRDYTLKPFFRLHDTPYAVYWDVMTEEDWARREADRRARAEKVAELDQRTVDRVRVGNEESETAHAMRGENTQSGHGAYGQHMRRQWRHAGEGGWFSYDMVVRPGEAAALLCTYWGREVGQRTFDILVNGTLVATQTLDGNHPEDFYDVSYPIPPELIGNAEKVTVQFRPHDGNTAGGVFGVRIVRP